MKIIVSLACLFMATSMASSEMGVEPMVAFMCNRPAMHMTDRGWTKDDATNCLKDPVDILNYCRKIYPKLDVWNIVEASQASTVKNWCNFGHSRCHNKFSVRPYRCLIGSFESEALEVPEHCHFDHVHNAEECKSPSAWNQTTAELCANRGARLRGFSILQPCGIDGFSGAEYVCCPPPQLQDGTEKRVNDTIRTSPVITTKRTTASSVTPTSMTTTMTPTMTSTTPSGAAVESDYLRYLRNPVDPSLTEHEYFLHAKADLDKRHHEKVTKMMKEWASARHRVQEIKRTDAKGGEKFNREMTARFQKAYESLEREGSQQKKQLTAVHQQRVQAELNKKKRQAMDNYLEALRDEEPDATRVLKSLMHYIKTEQKDRIHTINHYQHVQESDPVEAESIRSDIADHLRGTDQRVTQAIDMLDQLPKYEKKIRAQIEKFLSSYQSLDESLSVIMTKINEQSNAGKKSQKKIEAESEIGSSTSAEPLPTEGGASASSSRNGVFTSSASVPSTTSTTTTEDTQSSHGVHHLSSPHSVPHTSVVEQVEKVEKEAVDKETGKRHHYMEVKPADHVAYVDKSDLVVLENYIKKRPVKADSGFNVAAPLGIAVGGIAVFVAIIVGIALLRKRVTSAPGRQSVTEIDRRASVPTTDGAAAGAGAAPKKAPQINGYENPTYHYYAANA